jgi:hypothetical protein
MLSLVETQTVSRHQLNRAGVSFASNVGIWDPAGAEQVRGEWRLWVDNGCWRLSAGRNDVNFPDNAATDRVEQPGSVSSCLSLLEILPTGSYAKLTLAIGM